MGKIKVNGIDFYYEIHGQGKPLVLFEGLGYASWMWYKQIDELSKHFKLIIFDTRGVGQTEKPDMEYTIELFADDAALLLQALGIEKAHVLGVSMGGFVAQEFAINYPEMTDKLIVCCTSFGGPNSIPIPDEVLEILTSGGGKYKTLESIKYAISTAICKDKIAERMDIIDKIADEKMKNPQPKYAYQRQFMAGASYNSEDRLRFISAETLVLFGKEDRVVPAENAMLLQEKIPYCHVNIIEDAGHLFFMECPEMTNEIIVNFLKEK